MTEIRITPEPHETNVVADVHLGLNFVADWERVGSRPWERFDDVVSTLGIRDLRYPGGVTAEVGFDIRNPNATLINLGSGSTREIMGAYDFARFSRDQGISSSFIIPTEQLLLDTRDATGMRRVDPAMLSYVHNFVLGVLRASEGTVSVFEIGNEYESYMSAREYGALVNVLAPIVGSAIDQFMIESGVETGRPAIAMQVWSWLANDQSALTVNDLRGRATNAIAQLSVEARNEIDVIATHWYARDRGRNLVEAYHDLERDVLESMSIVTHGQRSFGRETTIYVSEWNANHNAVPFFGLAQIPIAVRLFAELIQAGANSMSFWSAMYQSTSLALVNGDLTSIGAVFNYLRSNVIEKRPIDLEIEDRTLGGVGFVGAEQAIVFISNLSSNARSLDIVEVELFSGFVPVRIGHIEVDASGADGRYRNYTNLSAFNEPDLPGFISWSSDPGQLTSLTNLDSFQSVIIEYAQRVSFQGSSRNDRFEATSSAEHFRGGDGSDTVSYVNSQTGVLVVLGERGQGRGDSLFDVFSSIENIVGSSHGDNILGDNSNNIISGGAGNDYLHGYGGNDVISSGSGRDTIFGGSGNDRIVLDGTAGEASGGAGDDVFVLSRGGYAIFGQDGRDELDLSNANSGSSIWFDSGSVDFLDSIDRVNFRSIEVFNLTQFDDRITVYDGLITAHLNAGRDYAAFFEGASGEVFGGSDADYLLSKSIDLRIFGGSGDDTIFTSSLSVNSINPGEGDDTVYSFGEDEFFFEVGDGNDTWLSFDSREDTLVLGSQANSLIQSSNYSLVDAGRGAELRFSSGDSIQFLDRSTTQILSFLDDFLL